jgi:hypothetical protein
MQVGDREHPNPDRPHLLRTCAALGIREGLPGARLPSTWRPSGGDVRARFGYSQAWRVDGARTLVVVAWQGPVSALPGPRVDRPAPDPLEAPLTAPAAAGRGASPGAVAG